MQEKHREELESAVKMYELRFQRTTDEIKDRDAAYRAELQKLT